MSLTVVRSRGGEEGGCTRQYSAIPRHRTCITIRPEKGTVDAALAGHWYIDFRDELYCN